MYDYDSGYWLISATDENCDGSANDPSDPNLFWEMWDWDSQFVNDTALSFAILNLSLSSTCLAEILVTVTQSVGFGFAARELDLKFYICRYKIQTLDVMTMTSIISIFL